MLTPMKWLGTAAGILGALLMALNIPWSGWAFALFLVSSLVWTGVGLLERDGALAALNLAFVAVDVLGIFRWIV